MLQLTQYTKQGAIGVITLNNPPLNALTQTRGLLQEIKDHLATGQADTAVKAFVLIGANRNFSAGADISEFGKPTEPTKADLRQLTEYMDTLTKPLVAAIHGPTMGGGLELAMACHYRVAAPDAQLALPEVKLGLLPGAGGTQRLPRLIGAEQSLRMITTGEPIKAEKGAKLGLVDELAQGDLLQAGIAYAEKVVAENKLLRRVRDLTVNVPGGPDVFFPIARAEVAKASRGFPAPMKCFECVEDAARVPYDQGYANERTRFMELIVTTESKAQRHAFFAEREASKIPDVPDTTPISPLKSAAVIGASPGAHRPRGSRRPARSSDRDPPVRGGEDERGRR